MGSILFSGVGLAPLGLRSNYLLCDLDPTHSLARTLDCGERHRQTGVLTLLPGAPISLITERVVIGLAFVITLGHYKARGSRAR